MSLGAAHPEKFEAALRASVARQVVSTLSPGGTTWKWPGHDTNTLEEAVIDAREWLSVSDTAHLDLEPGRELLYAFLIEQADNRDVLERFFDSLGLRG